MEYDIAVIGAGPAGLTAAIYGLRAGKSVVVFESGVYGGQIVNAANVENYPGIQKISGYELATAIYNQALSLGMKIKFMRVERIADSGDKKRIICMAGEEYTSRTIIVASGVTKRKLEVQGEERLIGKGVSYCATCDGAFFRGRNVAVIGGGNTALMDAVYLADVCNKVYVLHRRNEFRGDEKSLQKTCAKKNIELITDVGVKSINGSDSVRSLSYTNNKTGEAYEVPVEAVFIAVGQKPDTDFLLGYINIDYNGYIESSEDCSTSVNGIYAAGDCRSKSCRQLTTAVADGTIAAISCLKLL